MIEYYSCRIDLLGQAGRLDKGKGFLAKMPIKATAALWGSLLCACRWHKNVDFRERVAECIFVLNPKDATPYVLLSNISAAVGR